MMRLSTMDMIGRNIAEHFFQELILGDSAGPNFHPYTFNVGAHDTHLVRLTPAGA